MKTSTSQKLLTCILPKGKTLDVIETLKNETGIITTNFSLARATGRMMHRELTQTEKEILTLVVEDIRADELFEFIYRVAEIDQPQGGIIYQTDLSAATSYTLPDLPQEQ